MQNSHQYKPAEARFESDSMQVLTRSRSKDPQLPIVHGPVDFTVMRSDGLFSNRWGVDVNGNGDAYVYCRDNPLPDQTVLHASGKQRISLREDLPVGMEFDHRLADMWIEPEFDSEAEAAFSLVFPPWGAWLESTDFRRGIKKDELLVVGHRQHLLMVGFFIVNKQIEIRGQLPHIVLGELPVNQDKTLYVIAWRDPQKIAKLSPAYGESTTEVQGYRRPDSAYMVVCPIRYTTPKSEKILREISVRRWKAMQALADR